MFRYFLLFVLVGCASKDTPRDPASQNRNPKSESKLETAKTENDELKTELKENEEVPIPAPKKSETKKLANTAVKLQSKVLKAKRGKFPRMMFTKSHGCIHGELITNKARTLEDPTRRGIFRDDTKFNVWARFSNGWGQEQDDHVKDLRGLSVKVFGVHGQRKASDKSSVQDFLLTNAPMPLLSDAKSYLDLAKFYANYRTKKRIPTSVARNYSDLLKAAIKDKSKIIPETKKRITQHEVYSLVTEQYYSGTAFRFGDDKVAKLLLSPCTNSRIQDEKKSLFSKYKDHPDYLAEDLADTLEKNDLCFDILAQFQEDKYVQPTNDFSVEWKTKFHKVGQLKFERQKFRDFENPRDPQMAFCDGLAFSPSHTIDEHEPVGFMNRARDSVYSKSGKMRTKGLDQSDGSERFYP